MGGLPAHSNREEEDSRLSVKTFAAVAKEKKKGKGGELTIEDPESCLCAGTSSEREKYIYTIK